MDNKNIDNNKNIVLKNKQFSKESLSKFIKWMYLNLGISFSFSAVEELKSKGFLESTFSGVSIGYNDFLKINEKFSILEDIKNELFKSKLFYLKGLKLEEENINFKIDKWDKISESLKTILLSTFCSTIKLNPVYMMSISGARGNISQIRQLLLMRGFMSDYQGNLVTNEIGHSLSEGLYSSEFFISCLGARKGLIDTALRTADTGYLTRRLIDICHYSTIKIKDCGTEFGLLIETKKCIGKVLLNDLILNVKNKKYKLCEKNTLLTEELCIRIEFFFNKIYVRSPICCKIEKGICQYCYGLDLSNGKSLSTIGDAVGILAGQSIGEPGTQLTMRTFHTGGIFSTSIKETLLIEEEGILNFPESIEGVLTKIETGEICFLTKEKGIYFINDKMFELDKYTLLFRKNNEYVFKGDLLGISSKCFRFNESSIEEKIIYNKTSGLLKRVKNTLELSSCLKIPEDKSFLDKLNIKYKVNGNIFYKNKIVYESAFKYYNRLNKYSIVSFPCNIKLYQKGCSEKDIPNFYNIENKNYNINQIISLYNYSNLKNNKKISSKLILYGNLILGLNINNFYGSYLKINKNFFNKNMWNKLSNYNISISLFLKQRICRESSFTVFKNKKNKVKYNNILIWRNTKYRNSNFMSKFIKRYIDNKINKNKIYPMIKFNIDKTSKLIGINKNKILIEPIEVYNINNKNIFKITEDSYLNKNDILYSLKYKEILPSNISQGIKYIERLFEGQFKKLILEENGVLINKYIEDFFFKNITKYKMAEGNKYVLFEIGKLLVENIQLVYKSQGVNISNKHVEVIVKEMISYVRIINPGKSNFVENQIVHISKVENYNLTDGLGSIQYIPNVVGLTKSSLLSESFLSSASFQETSKVLMENTIKGTKDLLVGLKENVVVGNKIPAGTNIFEDLK